MQIQMIKQPGGLLLPASDGYSLRGVVLESGMMVPSRAYRERVMSAFGQMIDALKNTVLVNFIPREEVIAPAELIHRRRTGVASQKRAARKARNRRG